jgi:hypothetical protein
MSGPKVGLRYKDPRRPGTPPRPLYTSASLAEYLEIGSERPESSTAASNIAAWLPGPGTGAGLVAASK